MKGKNMLYFFKHCSKKLFTHFKREKNGTKYMYGVWDGSLGHSNVMLVEPTM